MPVSQQHACWGRPAPRQDPVTDGLCGCAPQGRGWVAAQAGACQATDFLVTSRCCGCPYDMFLFRY